MLNDSGFSLARQPSKVSPSQIETHSLEASGGDSVASLHPTDIAAARRSNALKVIAEYFMVSYGER